MNWLYSLHFTLNLVMLPLPSPVIFVRARPWNWAKKKEDMCKEYRQGELKQLNGGCNTSGERYCSDLKEEVHRRRRKRMCNTHVMADLVSRSYWKVDTYVMMRELLRQNMFLHMDLLCTYLLRLAPTILERKCSFMPRRMLLCNHHISTKNSRVLNEQIAKAKNLSKMIPDRSLSLSTVSSSSSILVNYLFSVIWHYSDARPAFRGFIVQVKSTALGYYLLLLLLSLL